MRCVPVVVVLGLLASQTAAADEPAPAPLPKDRVGVDAAFVLPVDAYGDEADLGVGALVRYERRMGSKLHLTARGGPLLHAMNVEGHGLTMAVVLAGMRYNLDPDRESGTFFSMAIGMNLVHATASAGGVSSSATEPEIALDIGGGFQIKKVQVGASIFYTPHVGASFTGDRTSYLGMALAIGYDFLVR